ncbi:hypothetical protein HA402_000257 [Bradysia odoriphaga]|nr:hypothetical protein HA402_000257 [Bradysia odoriphaga]
MVKIKRMRTFMDMIMIRMMFQLTIMKQLERERAKMDPICPEYNVDSRTN